LFKNEFVLAYQGIQLINGAFPLAVWDKESHEVLCKLARLRVRDWATSVRWNHRADEVGLAGELAALRFFDVPVEEAHRGFIEGLNGDRGVDFEWGGETIDVKTTAGDKLWFRFSLKNRHRGRASVILFAQLLESDAGATVVLHGWAFKHKINPFLREDKDGKRLFVRLDTLQREGLVHTIEELKGMEGQNVG
jgi:hypothetical protein